MAYLLDSDLVIDHLEAAAGAEALIARLAVQGIADTQAAGQTGQPESAGSYNRRHSLGIQLDSGQS